MYTLNIHSKHTLKVNKLNVYIQLYACLNAEEKSDRTSKDAETLTQQSFYEIKQIQKRACKYKSDRITAYRTTAWQHTGV